MVVKKVEKKSRKKLVTNRKDPNLSEKSHPWRICPGGQHWVKTHDLHVPTSKKNPDGLTTRQGHCAWNPSGKDTIYLDEIYKIADENFLKLKGGPNPDNLGFDDGSKNDDLIRGWSKYWNDIFKPIEPLDADVVKALIASESGFNPKLPPQRTKGAGLARGLTQITDQSRKILRDPKGELKNHLIYLDQVDLSDPNASICAGIRWLFHKMTLAAVRLKKEATWEEAIAEYKGYLKDILSGKDPNPRGMKTFKEKLLQLKKGNQ